MTQPTPAGCGCERPRCRRCRAPSATTGAPLGLSAPVRVPLDEHRRQAAISALAALLAPYLAATSCGHNSRQQQTGRRRAGAAPDQDGPEHDGGAATDPPGDARADPDESEESPWPEGP